MAEFSKELFFGKQKVIIDDILFKMHYIASVVLLLICSLIVLSDTIRTPPIVCGSPSDLGDDYIANCWRLGMLTTINQTVFGRWENEAKPLSGKYHYSCQLLLIQALLFYLPYYLWKYVEGDGMKLLLNGMQHTHGTNIKQIKQAAKYFTYKLGKRNSYFWSYICAHLINIVNIIIQFMVISFVFGLNFFSYGIIYGMSLNSPTTYASTVTAPKVGFPMFAYCIMPDNFGGIGNKNVLPVYKYGSCIIAINDVNSKIYFGIWIWYTVLALASILFLMYTLCKFADLNGVFNQAKKKFGQDFTNAIVTLKTNYGDTFILAQMIKNISCPDIFGKFILEINSLLKEDAEKKGVVVVNNQR